MRFTAPPRAATVAMLTLCAGSTPAIAGSIDYLQNFSATKGQTPLGAVGWTAYYGNATTSATTAGTGSGGNPPTAMLSAGASAPTDGPDVNATAPVSVTSNGFVPLQSTNGAYQFLLASNNGEHTIDPATKPPTTFNWYGISQYAGDTQQLAVMINSQWYVSTQVNRPNGGAAMGSPFGNSTLNQRFAVNYDPSAGNWETLTLSNGMVLGSVLTASLPAGTITNFGLYATIADSGGTTTTDERTYVDSFEVTVAAPEPASIALLGSAGATLLARRRRVRR